MSPERRSWPGSEGEDRRSCCHGTGHGSGCRRAGAQASRFLGNSAFEPRPQLQSEKRQWLMQDEPARGNGTPEGQHGCPADRRVGRQEADSELSATRVVPLRTESLEQGAKADSEPPACKECRRCGQPCQQVCWIVSCCRTTATCYEITGRACTHPSHHQRPHQCGWAARANTFVPKLTSKCRPWRAAALDSPLWVLVATARTRTSECRA